VENFSTDSAGMRSEVRGGSFAAFGSADFWDGDALRRLLLWKFYTRIMRRPSAKG
jgi:hypothetical protein